MSKAILITGGAGFVGSHLADALLERGHHVRVLDNLTPQVHRGKIPDYLSHEVEFMEGDVRDASIVARALKDCEVVFHLAAAVGVGQSMYEISNYMSANTQGTANLLQVMLDTKSSIEKLIVASSMSIYGEGRYRCAEHGSEGTPPRPVSRLKQKRWEPACPECGADLEPIPTDESKPLQSTSYYALSKKDQEEMCLLYGRTYGLPVVALRYFNIFGTRQALSNPYTGVVAIFASRLLNDKPPLIFEDGRQMRDFVSVHDIVQANLLAMERSAADGQVLNIGSGTPTSISEVASTLDRALAKKNPAEIMGKYRAGDTRHCYADIARATRLLGYSPRVSLDDGMKELVEWLRTQSAEDGVERAAMELSTHGLTS